MKVAIIGGYGKMGKWFARFLAREGKQVVIAGRDQRKLLSAGQELGVETATTTQVVKDADVIIISVPIDSFESVVKEIAPYVLTGQLIIDITSVKTRPVEIMHRYIKSGSMLGVHPMFGPGANGIAGQRFVLTPANTKEEETAEKTRRYLEERDAIVFIMSTKEHDEIMSIVLGLSHFIALATADTLLSLGKLKEAYQASGTSYRMLLTLAEGVLSEDAEFYSSLQMNLPGMAGIEKLFQDKVDEWRSLVNLGDRSQFSKRMDELKHKFMTEDPHFHTAYKHMYQSPEQ